MTKYMQDIYDNICKNNELFQRNKIVDIIFIKEFWRTRMVPVLLAYENKGFENHKTIKIK